MSGGDLSSFEARYSFCLGCVVHILDTFFSVSFSLGSVYSRVFSLACIFFNFSTALLLLGFPLSLQDLQRLRLPPVVIGAVNSRRERMALVLCCHIT